MSKWNLISALLGKSGTGVVASCTHHETSDVGIGNRDAIVRVTSEERYRLSFGYLHDALPASWLPGDAAERDAFVACAPAVRFAQKRGRTDLARMVNARGDWVGFGHRLAAAHGRAGPEGLRQALRDVSDVVDAFGAQVLHPALRLSGLVMPQDGHPKAFDVLFANRSVCRILEESRHWHARQASILTGIEALGAPIATACGEWAAVLPDATLGDVAVKVLTSRVQLRHEGGHGLDPDGVEGLDHCVANHAGACLDGRTRVLSMRTTGDDPRRLSTAEVTWAKGRSIVLEHRGRGNAEPCHRASHALAAYLAALADGTLVASAPCLDWMPVEGRSDGKGRMRCGYDWRVPGNWETARELWRPHLPRTMRDASARLFASATGGVPRPDTRTNRGDDIRVRMP